MKALAWHFWRRRKWQQVALCCLATGLRCDTVAGALSPGAETELPLQAAPPEELGYSVTHWTAEDGLPERTVTCLAQTPDGYLWCGTYSGLARYDGVRFRVFQPAETPELNGVQIAELCCDAAGRLWIGGSAGELLVYENRQFRRVRPEDGMPADQAGKMGLDGDDFWVKGRSNDRFYCYRGPGFEAVVYPRIPGAIIDRFQGSASGLKWGVHEQERTLIRFTPNGPEVESLAAPGGEPERKLGRFFRLQDGSLSVTASKGVYALQDAQWRLRIQFERAVNEQALDGVEDWDGNFWVSFVGVGLVFHERGGRTRLLALPEQADAPYLRAVMFGMEGNVWAAGDDGLYQIQRETFRRQPGSEETRNRPANAIVEAADGSVWTLYHDGMARWSGGRWEYFSNPQNDVHLANGARCADGGIYLGYVSFESGKGYLERMTVSGERQRLGSVTGFIHCVFESKQGELWVGTDRGLWRRSDGDFVRVPITGVSGEYFVYAMTEHRDGHLLVAAFRHGLFRQREGGTWERLTTTNDFGSDFIVSLYRDEANIIWAATDRGLARWNDRGWFAYSLADGALPGWVRGVVSDGHGGLWLTSQFGVTRVETAQLHSLADKKVTKLDSSRFDRSDGLPSVTCMVNQQAVLRSADGRIWVGTAKGPAVADPAYWRQKRARLGAPRVQIETVLVDDNALTPFGGPAGRSGAATLAVPSAASRVEFRYSAVNLSANRKCRFRYRLDGADQAWVDADEQRSVAYYRLPPGDYLFRVTAANHYGLWNEAGASLAFSVQPKWWQTWSFRGGLGALMLGLLWLSRSIKLRQIRRERVRAEEFSRRLIESQEAERKRIASELHDSLGQNLLIAKNQLFLVQEMSGEQDGEIQPKLQQIAESVGAALEEARAISHQLRPFQIERLGLTKAIRSIVRQTSDSTRLPIEARIESVDALLPAESEVMIYRILQEALSNIIRHADASQVRIALERQGAHLHLVVQDDGRGFEAETFLDAENAARGLGLTGFEERARLLGGHFRCQSAPGQGTTLTFEIPIPETKARDAKH